MTLLKSIKAPYLRFPNEVSSQDLLKSIAIIAMIIDHLGYYFYQEEIWLRAIGRVVAPIWFFFVGYNYKRSNFHIKPIFYMAMLVQLTTCLYGGASLLSLNVLFTIIIAKGVIDYYEQYKKTSSLRLVFLAILVAVLYSFTSYFVQYGILGIYMSLWGYNYRHEIGSKFQQSLLSFILIFVTQVLSFKFDMLEQSLFVLLLCPLIYALYVYKPIKLNIHGIFKYIINVSARYSLYIYCFHIILFVIIYKYIANAN